MHSRQHIDGAVCGTVLNDAMLKGVCVSVLIIVLGLLVVLDVLPASKSTSIFLLAASGGFLVVRFHGAPDLFHPVRLFGALWCACLGLASLRLLSVLSEWDYLTWSCFVTALASFITGFWLYSKSGIRSNHGNDPATVPLPTKRTLKVAASCIAVGVAVLAYEYSLVGAIPVFSDNVDVIRMELFGAAGQGNPQFNKIHIKILHFFVEFTKYGIILCSILIFQTRSNRRVVTLQAFFLILIATLAYASQGGRLFIVEVSITLIVFFHYLRSRIGLAKLGIGVLALFLFVGLAGSARVKQSELAPLFQKGLSESNFPEGEFWQGVAFGYGTLTSSFEVFHRLTLDLQTVEKPSHGFLFYGFHRFIPRANLQEFTFDLYGGEMIVPTFLGEFYADYGYKGVLFGPLVLGWIYGWVYARGAIKNPLYAVYVRALFTKMLILFPYVNLFSQYLTWIFDLAVMYWLIRSLTVHPGQKLTQASCVT